MCLPQIALSGLQIYRRRARFSLNIVLGMLQILWPIQVLKIYDVYNIHSHVLTITSILGEKMKVKLNILTGKFQYRQTPSLYEAND